MAYRVLTWALPGALPGALLGALVVGMGLAAGPVLAQDLQLSDEVKVDVYGFVLVNTQYTSGRTAPADVPVWALDEDDDEAFNIFAHQTRFGFKLTAPNVGSAALTGDIELDLYGLRGDANPGGITQTAPRTRLAYLKLDWEDTALTVGQDWVRAFAPLNPTSLAKMSIVEFSGSGNLWNRIPQIRLDHNLQLTDDTKALFNVALLKPFGADADPTRPVDSDGDGDVDAWRGVGQGDLVGGGEQSGLPFVQARAAFNMPIGKRALEVGFAGHYGREDYAEEDLLSYGLALDLDVPFSEICGLMGELYTGRNLRMFFSNSFHLGNPNLDSSADEQRADGGWVQLTVKPNDPGSINVGYGYEDLDDADEVGAGAVKKNQTIFANYLHSFTERFRMAFEVIRIDTNYENADDEDALVCDLAWQLLF
ncbi:MAG: hypothetical protein AB1486_02505 [Planctomycetota bacterium]